MASTTTANAAATLDYDLLAELKAFDETKAGVKGLADSGITEVPRIFHMPSHLLDEGLPFAADDPNFIFPIIDLQGGQDDPEARKKIVKRIRDASENWGFFQIVNHGVPVNIMEEMMAGVHRFFDLDVEEKKEHFSVDLSKKVISSSNSNVYNAPAANWRDSILCFMAPDPPKPEQLPACCSEIMTEYTGEMMKVGELLFQLLSEGLGLSSNHLKEMEDCLEVVGLGCNYLPPCPQPKLTLGTIQHTDTCMLTVILQDHLGGLQILHRGHWVDVPFMPGGLVVNIGDILQLISNDKLTSVVHRVRVKEVGPRVSVATFFGHASSSSSKTYGPIKNYYRKRVLQNTLKQPVKTYLFDLTKEHLMVNLFCNS